MRRQNNPKLLNATKNFVPLMGGQKPSTCGNIVYNGINPSDHKSADGLFKDKYLFDVVSAPMLLARLVAAFEYLKIECHGQEAYKVTWETALVHPKSGHVVTFYDWKGAASIGSDVYGDNAPKEFIKDVKALLLALADEQFPHPYDGIKVGEVA